MQDGHLGRYERASHGFQLTANKIHPVYRTSYRAGQTARLLAAKELQKRFQEEFIEQADTERACCIVFVLTKDGSLRFSGANKSSTR